MLLLKVFTGSLIVALIVILNKILGPTAAAISSWFPVFTIIGLILVKNNQNHSEQENIQNFIVGGIWSLILLAGFSIAIYLLIEFTSLYLSLLASSLIWLIGASLFVYLNNGKDNE